MDGQQVWQFGGIAMSADSIRKAGASVAAEQDAIAIKGNLAVLASTWGGASSDLYQALQLNEAVISLANAIDNANTHMQSTEAKVGARFM